ncbi:MAG: hypothetical protein R2735_16240 [Microthrixaceae bacterium]
MSGVLATQGFFVTSDLACLQLQSGFRPRPVRDRVGDELLKLVGGIRLTRPEISVFSTLWVPPLV